MGGGTAGWMAAAALTRVLNGLPIEITLVESEAIGTVGVGEATIPSLPAFHGLLGVDEREFVNATHATIKLGIEFRDWSRIREGFLHPFGPYGIDANHELFQAYWLKRRQEGRPSSLEEWSVTAMAARLGRFASRPSVSSVAERHLSYAYHLDASLYARFLQAYAEKHGVRRIEGMVIDAEVDEQGLIEALRLRDGRAVSGDFFIDCSGFQAFLIEKTLKTGYEDWAHWLPCDRAVAAQCRSAGDPAPLTRSTAREAGWQWRIPLQHRIGNGYVYCSAYLEDGAAIEKLTETLEGAMLSEPRLLRFRAGRRRSAWVGNCLALGLAAGFLEPLESTSIHFVQTGLARLFSLFPDRNFDPAVSGEYNRLTALEYERARDFLILHYAASNRDDTPFWRHCRAMTVPETLAYKRELFTRTSRIALLEEETFQPSSWLALYTGLGIWPERHEPVVDIFASTELIARHEAMRGAIRSAVEMLPAYATHIGEVTKLA